MKSVTQAASPAPGDVRELRWWSARNLATLSGRLDAACRTWAARWELALDAVVVLNGHDAAPSSAWLPWQVAAGAVRPWAWTAVPDDAPGAAIARAMFGRSPEGSIASDLAQRAWTDLGDDVARLFGHALPDMPAATFARPHTLPWSGGIAARLRVSAAESADIWLHIDAGSAATLARDLNRPRAAASAPLEASVLGVLANRPFTLRAELAPAVVDIGTLQSLRIGDVLTLPHRLDEPLKLRPDGGTTEVACVGYLGARDGRRAVELIRHSDH